MANTENKTSQSLASWVMAQIQECCPVVGNRLESRENWTPQDPTPQIRIIIIGDKSAVHISYKSSEPSKEKRYDRAITYAEIKDIIDEILKDHNWISQANYTTHQNNKYKDGELEWSFRINWQVEFLKGINCSEIALNIVLKDNLDLQRHIISSLYDKYFENVKDKAPTQELANLLGEEDLLVRSYIAGEKLESLEDTITVWDYLSALNPGLEKTSSDGFATLDLGIFDNEPFTLIKIDYSKLYNSSIKYHIKDGKLHFTVSLSDSKDASDVEVITRTISLNNKLSLYCGNKTVKEILEEEIEKIGSMQEINQVREQARLQCPLTILPPFKNYTLQLEALKQLLRRINSKQTKIESGPTLTKTIPPKQKNYQ